MELAVIIMHTGSIIFISQAILHESYFKPINEVKSDNLEVHFS